MGNLIKMFYMKKNHKRAGMEMVQVAILIAIAIAAGLIFKDKIGGFISDVFGGLEKNSFTF